MFFADTADTETQTPENYQEGKLIMKKITIKIKDDTGTIYRISYAGGNVCKVKSAWASGRYPVEIVNAMLATCGVTLDAVPHCQHGTGGSPRRMENPEQNLFG